MGIERDGEEPRTIESDASDGIYGWFEATVAALVERDGERRPCTLAEAIANLEILVAADCSSAAGGAPVALPVDDVARQHVLRVA